MAIKLTKEQVQDIREVALACQSWAQEKQKAARFGDAEVAFYKEREEKATRVLDALPKPKAVEIDDEDDEDENLDSGEDAEEEE